MKNLSEFTKQHNACLRLLKLIETADSEGMDYVCEYYSPYGLSIHFTKAQIAIRQKERLERMYRRVVMEIMNEAYENERILLEHLN